MAIFFKNTPKNCHFKPKKPKRRRSFLALLTIGSCPRLLREHVQNVLAKVDCADCEIIMFEVTMEKKVIFSYA